MSDGVGARSERAARPSRPTERLAEDVADVIREEVRDVRGQLTEAARPAGVGVALLATAGGCVVLGVGATSTTVLRMLETFLPRRLAAAGLTAGYFAAAAVLGRLGLQQLRTAGGSSAWLADEVTGAVSATASRVVPAGASAARDELTR